VKAESGAATSLTQKSKQPRLYDDSWYTPFGDISVALLQFQGGGQHLVALPPPVRYQQRMFELLHPKLALLLLSCP
jgi:hypothetical protein